MQLKLRHVFPLISAVFVFAGGLGAASAEPTVTADGRTSYYQDTDETTISTTVVALSGKPIDELTIWGHYLADIVSSASVDVVSAATDRWTETRHEGTWGAAYYDGTNTVGGGYTYSVEHDWRSHTGSLAVSHDILNHTITLGASGSFTANDIGRAGDANFKRDGVQGSGGLSASFVLTRTDLVSVAYTFVYIDGYNASPYRFVRFKDPSSAVLVGGPENVPDVRIRHAVGGLWNHHMFHDTVLRTQLRAYGDDWGILSLMGGTEYVVGLWKLELGAFVRGYLQTGASFYQDTYDQRYEFMTADRELSSFFDVFGGGRVAFHSGIVGPFEDVHAELKLTGFTFYFSEFERLPERQGFIADLALGVGL